MRKQDKVILNVYKTLANIIDKEIQVQYGEYWTSTPIFKQVIVQQKKDKQKDIDNFTNFIKTLLPKDKKYLSKQISIEMWSFLHECGHINNCDIYDPIFSLRNVINFIAYHFGQFKIIDKFTTYVYFNLKEEKNATLWAIQYVLDNEFMISHFSKVLNNRLCKQ
jgi:hypothetical protein